MYVPTQPSQDNALFKTVSGWCIFTSMRRASLALLGIIALGCMPVAVNAQSITVSVSKTKIYENEDIELVITAQGDFDQIALPPFKDFVVLSSSRSMSISIINGVMSRQQKLYLTLGPKRTGRLTIGPVKLIKGNRVLKASNPIEITVLPSNKGYRPSPVQPPRTVRPSPVPPPVPGITPGTQKRGALFIRVVRPNRPVYVGEPFFVEYDLAIRSDIIDSVTDVSTLEMPDFQGVVTQELEVPKRPRRTVIDGTSYHLVAQWRGILTPLKAGKVTLGAMKLRVTIAGFMLGNAYQVRSQVIPLEVKDVPQEGRPSGYYGLVGQFIAHAKLSSTTVKAGSSLVLTIEVSGTGSLKSIQPPRLFLDPKLRVEPLPSGDMDEIKAGIGGLYGKRVFQYLITPTVAGTYKIPSIKIPFFNPLKGKFEVATTKAKTFIATPAGKGNVVKHTTGIRLVPYPKFVIEEERKPSAQYKGILLIVAVVPLLFYGIAEGIRLSRMKRLKDPEGWLKDRAEKVAMKQLKMLKEEDPQGILERLPSIIEEFIINRYGINIKGLTVDQTEHSLVSKGVSPQDARELRELLEALAFARFAPAGMDSDSVRDLKDRCIRLIKRLGKEG